jgi:putative spermidine/putrescine transport system substrate-binding protein
MQVMKDVGHVVKAQAGLSRRQIRPKPLSRRKTLKLLAATGASGVLATRASLAAPPIAKGAVLTVSTWGGVTQDAIRKNAEPSFTKATGATLAYDIGAQGPRYSKLVAQRASPSADVFFGSDESLIAGLKAGILTPARKKNLANLADISPWALTVPSPAGPDTIGGTPYGLISYVIGYDPDRVKTPITSWNDLWRPEFAGKLAYASPFHSMMPALVVTAAELAGGSMTNVNSGFEKLAQLRPAKLGFTWTDWAALYKSGDVIIATEFDCYLDVMKSQDYGIQYVVPKEKGLACIDGVGIVKGRPNVELAEYFLDVIMNPDVQIGLSRDLLQGPINSKAKLPPDIASKCSCGANIADLRFFDPEPFVALRPVWTERMKTEVMPNWAAR